MLQAMPRSADTWDPKCRCRPAHTGHGNRHGVVSDAVKAGLQSSQRAGDHVIGDLLLGQVTGTARFGIGVRLL
jgi:hypothetical protein